MFGQHAVISGPHVVSTRMARSFASGEGYYVTVKAIRFGEQRVNFDPGDI